MSLLIIAALLWGLGLSLIVAALLRGRGLSLLIVAALLRGLGLFLIVAALLWGLGLSLIVAVLLCISLAFGQLEAYRVLIVGIIRLSVEMFPVLHDFSFLWEEPVPDIPDTGSVQTFLSLTAMYVSSIAARL